MAMTIANPLSPPSYDHQARGAGGIRLSKHLCRDASGPDIRASYETMMTLMATRQAGMNVIVHGAGIVGGSAAISLGQVVVGPDIPPELRKDLSTYMKNEGLMM